MRITIVCRILWTAGAPKLAARQAVELAKLGHTVKILFLRGSTLSGYSDILSGLDVDILDVTGNSLLSPLYDRVTRLFRTDRGSESRVDYNLIRKVPKWVRAHRPDLILCHDQWAGLAGYYAMRSEGVPYRVYAHESVSKFNVPILGAIAQAYERRVFQNADRVFAVTEQVGESIERMYHINCVANYIGMDIVQRVPYRNKSNTITSASMWDSGRRPESYLPLLQYMDGFDLNMVGRWRSDSLKESFMRRVRDLRLSDRVRMHIGISEQELSEIYSRSKFFIRFGFGEHGSGSTVEALSHALPVVASRDLGTSHLIQRFGAGLVVDETEPVAISRYLSSIDEEEAYARVQDNIARLAAEFSWHRHAATLVGK